MTTHSEFPHLPVLFHEIMDALQPKTGGRYVDCTLGAGGHSFGILEASSPDGQLLAFDLDASAIELAKQRLQSFGERANLQHASYLDLAATMRTFGWPGVDGIVIDFGVSSMQLDQPERGFSFREDGPLDMRFNPQTGHSAAQFLNSVEETELADILYKYGEEPKSRRIAAAICQRRPFSTTSELADLIKETVGSFTPRGRKYIHPATKTFQAIRIAINHELEAVEKIIPMAVQALNPKGRLAVLTFHSLEDRIVKHYFQQESHDCICPPEQLICNCGHQASIKRITKKPTRADITELKENKRARSAKLRIIEKLG